MGSRGSAEAESIQEVERATSLIDEATGKELQAFSFCVKLHRVLASKIHSN